MRSLRHSGGHARLPVSGLTVAVRQPTGEDDLILRETRMPRRAVACELAGRLATTEDGLPVNAQELCITDLESLLLRIRQAAIGDVILAEIDCRAKGCGARVDISFRVSDYLESTRTHTPRGVERDEAGWFRFEGGAARFRIPNGTDLAAAEQQRKPEAELMRRCMEPADLPAAVRRRIERAIESLAPLLSKRLTGTCPECGQGVEAWFDIEEYVVRELHQRAAGIYQDVHLLAFHYKWPEAQILALPYERRTEYVELLQNQGAAV